MHAIADRRKDIRINFSGLKFRSNSHGEELGYSQNISQNGIFIETKNPLANGKRFFLEFKLPYQPYPIKAYGEIIWKNTETEKVLSFPGMGIKFVNITPFDQKRLKKFLDSVNSNQDSYSDNLTYNNFIEGFESNDKHLFQDASIAFEDIRDLKRLRDSYQRSKVLSSINKRQGVYDIEGKSVKDIVMLSSNNYLGLVDDAKVIEATLKVIDKYGIGISSVPFDYISELHNQLEKKLASLTGYDAAVLFPTGYMANLGCVSGLIRRNDLVIVDEAIHSGVVDGCRLGKGSLKLFKHSDVNDLNKVLDTVKNTKQWKIVAIQGVYSIDGDIAPLPDIVEVSKKYGARLFVDDTFGIGVIGENGCGTVKYFKMESEVDVLMGSMSNVFGSIGGFAASNKKIANFFRYYSKPYFFDVNVPPALTASTIAALDIMSNKNELFKKLHSNTSYIRQKLIELNFDVIPSDSSIISILVYDEKTLNGIDQKLRELGVYMDTIQFPTVPEGQCRVRMKITAVHTKDQLDFVIQCIVDVFKQYNILDLNKRIGYKNGPSVA